MGKLRTYIILILCLGFTLIGCDKIELPTDKTEDLSEANYEETVIAIDKKSRVSLQIVESFARDYYNAEELKSDFQNAINEVNAKNEDNCKAALRSIRSEKGKVYVNLEFSSPKAYEDLQNQSLFVGTIKEAADNGYTMGVKLKNVTSGNLIGKVEIMGMLDRHIVILNEPVRVKLYRPIEYVSANVDVINENEVRVLSEAGGLAYIILDK